jgi:hypothetical protein
MRTCTVLVGVPAGMCVMFLSLRRFDLGSDGGTVTFVLGLFASGCVAGILAGWRIGFAAAACFVVFVCAFILLALLLAGPDVYA